jgi:agmatinase
MDLNDLRPMQFMGREMDFQNSKAVVVPLPYSSVPHTENSRNGPMEILFAWNFEDFDIELGYEPSSVGIYPLPERQYEGEKGFGAIQTLAEELFGRQKFPIFLGGDHSITISTTIGLKDTSVISFDAHTDLRDEYEGSRYSHMCVNRRISERSDVYIIGDRSIGKDEAEFLNESNVNAYGELSEDELNEILEKSRDNVYISIDADVFDPSIMPAVCMPEQGGMLWKDMMKTLKVLFERKNVVGMDICELSPIPSFTAPNALCAQLAYKCVGYKFAQKTADIL